MIFFAITLSLCLIAALFQPYGSRLGATGLWLGKVLVPPDAAGLYPRGLQDALTDGSISRITFVTSIVPYPICAIAFFYAWWAPLAAFAFYILVIAILGRTSIVSNQLDYYLNTIHREMGKRRISYEMAGDAERAEIIEELSQQVGSVLETYFNTGVPAPSFRDAKAAPFGDEFYLFDKFRNADRA